MTTLVQAYVNYGRWVADCPAVGCNSAAQLRGSAPPEPEISALILTDEQDKQMPWKRDEMFYCTACGQLAQVIWPDDEIGIFETLCERRNQANRNWYPNGHTFAVEHGLCCGQSVEELHVEHLAHSGDDNNSNGIRVPHGPYIDLEAARRRLT